MHDEGGVVPVQVHMDEVRNITGRRARYAADELHAAPSHMANHSFKIVELPRHPSPIHHAGVAEMLP